MRRRWALAEPGGLFGRYGHLGRLRLVGAVGGSGRAWLVDGADGPFVLRRFPSGLSFAQAEFAAAAQQRVATAGGPAMPVIADLSGRLVTGVNGRAFMLAVFAPGHCDPQGPPGPDRCRELGNILGRLHVCLGSCPDLAGGASPPRLQPAPGALTRALANHAPGCPHPQIRRVLTAKISRADALSESSRALVVQSAPSLIHGDFHLGNVVIADGRVRTVLDYDLVRPCAQGYEVVRGLLYCARPYAGDPLFPSRAQAFLSGYFEVSSLAEDDVARMVEHFRAVQVLDPHGLEMCAGADDELLRFGLARFRLLRWVEQAGAALTALAMAARQGAISPAVRSR